MDPGAPRSRAILLELCQTLDGRVEGTVLAQPGAPRPFSGWLELLSILESVLDHRSDPKTR
jgi:hypothetical protein